MFKRAITLMYNSRIMNIGIYPIITYDESISTLIVEPFYYASHTLQLYLVHQSYNFYPYWQYYEPQNLRYICRFIKNTLYLYCISTYQKITTMNYRWKIALLALLGFSTAACCSTKKTSKGKDKSTDNIEVEGIDNRVMLMYGVPMPDGSFPRPMPEEQPEIIRPGVPFPDGRVAIEMTEERAAEVMDKIKDEAKAEVVKEVDGVPFPDGRVAIVMTEERAAEIMELIKAEDAAKAAAEQE